MKLDTKNIFGILINIGLAIAILFLVIGSRALWNYTASLPAARTITVSAEGKAVATPDVASLSFGVVIEGTDPDKITQDSNKKISDAIEFVKTFEIDAKDIKTTGYDLSPRYQYDRKTGASSIVGYTIRQTVLVKIRKFENVGKIISGLPNQGINEINSLYFEVEDQDKFLNQAREEAFAKAAAKAKTMAQQNGVQIKKVVSFSESTGGYPMPIYARAEKLGGGATVPAIEPGSQEVTVQVNVIYEIK